MESAMVRERCQNCDMEQKCVILPFPYEKLKKHAKEIFW